MNRGLHIAAQGMNILALKHEIIANNLANVNTAGFKREVMPTRAFSSVFEEQLGLVGGGVKGEKPVIRDGQGAITVTGNPLNVAISGKGYFAVQTENGEAYTRSGNFGINESGELVNSSGLNILGEGGPITLPDGQVSFNESGDVMVDGRVVDTLKIVSISDNTAIKKLGNSLFDVTDKAVVGDKPEATQTVWKSVESSDVNAVEEMIQMIEVSRSFELSQKVIKSIDENLRQAVTLGRP